jgi:Ca-activated chloride channel homolog
MRTVLTLTLVLLCSFARAESGSDPDKTLSPYFFVEGADPGTESFPLKSTKVTANISGVIADVTVIQVYENRGNTTIHARYLFPGSTRAAVHGMRIRVGDKAVIARIRERQEAKREFDEAKAAGKSASLLEQQRPNVFSMAVANILPGDRVEVELTYSEMLVPEEGIYQFVYPTVVGPRYSNTPEAMAPEHDKWVKSPYLHEGKPSPATLSMRVNLSTGVPLADLRTRSHQTRIDWENPSMARVSLDNDSGTRDFILDYRLSGKEIQSGLLVFEGVRENFFLLTVQPPERIAARDIPPREYIFVLDVSGSMNGFPLDTAKPFAAIAGSQFGECEAGIRRDLQRCRRRGHRTRGCAAIRDSTSTQRFRIQIDCYCDRRIYRPRSRRLCAHSRKHWDHELLRVRYRVQREPISH